MSDYPAITDAVSSLTGLKVFGAGLLVIGVARLVMMFGLFLLFEDVAQSARVAGLAALFYTAHPNFVFFTGQYAYESLAFPLAVVAIATVNRWMLPDDPRTRRGWAIAALIAITGVVMTHHMTTYALVGFLLAASVAHHLLARQSRYWNPWPFAGFTVVAAVIWLVFVASDTAGYLSDHLREGFSRDHQDGGVRVGPAPALQGGRRRWQPLGRKSRRACFGRPDRRGDADRRPRGLAPPPPEYGCRRTCHRGVGLRRDPLSPLRPASLGNRQPIIRVSLRRRRTNACLRERPRGEPCFRAALDERR